MKRLTKSIAVLTAALGVTISSATMASASYIFEPGQPTFFRTPDNALYCTGGYAIHGTSGTFILTDGHCPDYVGQTVYGTQAAFGNIAYSHWPTYDTALISELAGDDAYQIVVDPITGEHPGTHGGRVVGIYPKSSLGVGTLVGKMGRTTGWEQGTIFSTISWIGFTAYCAHAFTAGGDSGGPVWRTDSNGDILAVGITVSYYPATGDGCFVPIQDILDNWGASLPVFPPSAASAKAAAVAPMPSASGAALPKLDPKLFVPAVGKR